jgi:hypothetical protein
VSFDSGSTNLVPGDTNGLGTYDVFVRDLQLNMIERVSITNARTEIGDSSGLPSISADGRCVAFRCEGNLVPEDMNGAYDIYLRDRGEMGLTSLCEPGVGVIICPCANSPGGAGRGCDNSAATGGAALAASGFAHLSMDSLMFMTSGEKPTALSIVMQGNGVISNGVAYGQGVRCVGGTIIRRLFIKSATSGSITAPEFDAGDPTVSARSIAKGDPIQAGDSRWYLVYYRDPTVLGGCPASSTFNATQTGQVTWWP